VWSFILGKLKKSNIRIYVICLTDMHKKHRTGSPKKSSEKFKILSEEKQNGQIRR